jgi:hypothetical protein
LKNALFLASSFLYPNTQSISKFSAGASLDYFVIFGLGFGSLIAPSHGLTAANSSPSPGSTL